VRQPSEAVGVDASLQQGLSAARRHARLARSGRHLARTELTTAKTPSIPAPAPPQAERRRASDPAPGEIRLALGTVDDKEAARALAYAVKRFAAADEAGTAPPLHQGLGPAVETAIARFDDWRRAVAEGRFSLAFQPIVRLADRRVEHYEVLARFPDGQTPHEVVGFGEEAGLIELLDLAICGKALAVLAATPVVTLAVNLSGRSVQSPAFRDALGELLRPHRLLLGRLMFELTESYAIEPVEAAVAFLSRLKADGCAICLDDFGAGAAAYHYLRHFAVDYVKLDGPFLKAALSNRRDRALIRSICGLCRELDTGVIGEMIEDEAALAAAVALGVDYGQGRLFGAPSPMLPLSHPTGEAQKVRRVRHTSAE
jgi:EAL domain-containing protein (putative c-di-GMP-specific phosphodiesterase class I)